MSEPGPLVSVVIPAYNAARTIEQTVQSALDQESVELEVIVVDDGSSDDTVTLVSAIPDERVHLVPQANGGAASARNTGIAHAKGDWVAFLDSDDLWVRHKLRAQLEALQGQPGGFAAQSSAFMVDDDMRVLHVRRCIQPENDLLTFLRFQNLPAAASSWIVRRDVLEQIGCFDPELVILEDWDLSLRLARHGPTLNMEEPLTLYRQHPGNRSLNLDIHVSPGFRVLGRLFADPALPQDIRDRKREVYARFYTMLCGGAVRARRPVACLKWGTRAVLTDPRMLGYVVTMPLRRLRRLIDGRRPQHRAE
jgi:glycosyltransferase involved in cell wall biosynthesis